MIAPTRRHHDSCRLHRVSCRDVQVSARHRREQRQGMRRTDPSMRKVTSRQPASSSMRSAPNSSGFRQVSVMRPRSTARSRASIATSGFHATSGPTRIISTSGSGMARRRAGQAGLLPAHQPGDGFSRQWDARPRRQDAGRFSRSGAAEPSGRALTKAVAAVQKPVPTRLAAQPAKAVPRGFDAGHERSRFLFHEGLYAGLELPADVAAKPGFGDLALRHFSATWPIGQWLLKEVAAG